MNFENISGVSKTSKTRYVKQNNLKTNLKATDTKNDTFEGKKKLTKTTKVGIFAALALSAAGCFYLIKSGKAKKIIENFKNINNKKDIVEPQNKNADKITMIKKTALAGAGLMAGATVLASDENKTDIKFLPEGEKVQALPESKKINALPEGKKVLTLPEGKKIKALPEGEKIKAIPEGKKVLMLPEGKKIQILPEGEKQLLPKEGEKPQVPSKEEKTLQPIKDEEPVIIPEKIQEQTSLSGDEKGQVIEKSDVIEDKPQEEDIKPVSKNSSSFKNTPCSILKIEDAPEDKKEDAVQDKEPFESTSNQKSHKPDIGWHGNRYTYPNGLSFSAYSIEQAAKRENARYGNEKDIIKKLRNAEIQAIKNAHYPFFEKNSKILEASAIYDSNKPIVKEFSKLEGSWKVNLTAYSGSIEGGGICQGDISDFLKMDKEGQKLAIQKFKKIQEMCEKRPELKVVMFDYSKQTMQALHGIVDSSVSADDFIKNVENVASNWMATCFIGAPL